MRLFVRTEKLAEILESYLEAEGARQCNGAVDGGNGTLSPYQQLVESLIRAFEREGRVIKPASVEKGVYRLRRKEVGEYTNHRIADRFVVAMRRVEAFHSGELEVLKKCHGGFCQGEAGPLSDFGTSRTGSLRQHCKYCEPQMKLF